MSKISKADWDKHVMSGARRLQQDDDTPWGCQHQRRLAVMRAMQDRPGASREDIIAATGLTYEQVREAMTIEYGPADEDEY